MKTIRAYIESLFLEIGTTAQTKKLKEDLLAGAEDRYEDLKAQGKSENEAIGGVISEFGSIDELLDELNIKQDKTEEPDHELDEISLEEAITFVSIRRRAATLIGLGVLSIMLGAALACLITALSMDKMTMVGLALFALFLGVAIGVPLFILAGMKMMSCNQQLEDRFIPLQVKNELKDQKEQFQRSFLFCISVGVVFCILAILPLIFFTVIFQEEPYIWLGLTCLFASASVGVFLFIFGGMVMGSLSSMYEQTYFISDQDKPGPRAKAARAKKVPSWLQLLEKIYWPLVAGIFLVQGFFFGNWASNWVIFPTAGIIFWVIESVFSETN